MENLDLVPIHHQKIILASKSPRRLQLLREAGFDPMVYTNEVEENYPEEMPVANVPGYLAEKKADAAAGILKEHPDAILLASDCIVAMDGIIYHKPTDTADACQILRTLSGNTHEVITGVCLISARKKVVFSETAKVTFSTLSEAEIQYYVHHFQPFDKAGAYAIQEWIGLCKIEKIEGTYSNIVGLPMASVYKALLQF